MSEKKHVLLEDKLVHFLQQNRTHIVIIFVLILLSCVLFYGLQYKETEAQKNVFEKVYFLQKAHKDHIKKTFQKTPTDKEWLKESQSYISNLERLFETYPDQNATFQGVLHLASMLRRYKQEQKALELIDKTIKHIPEENFLYSLFYLFKASLFEDRKETKKALLQYEHILNRKQLFFSHPEALLRKGFLYWKLGDTKKSEQILRKLLKLSKTDKQYAPWSSYAEAYLKMFLLKSKKPL